MYMYYYDGGGGDGGDMTGFRGSSAPEWRWNGDVDKGADGAAHQNPQTLSRDLALGATRRMAERTPTAHSLGRPEVLLEHWESGVAAEKDDRVYAYYVDGDDMEFDDDDMDAEEYGAADYVDEAEGALSPGPQPTVSGFPNHDAKPPPAKIKTRSVFPETWLWAGDWTTVKTKVPDTITSWVVSAFAVSDASGLGVAPTNPKLKVFRPFFAQLNLPYSVKRGEKVAIQALVFNYMDTDQTVTVTMKPNRGFRFVEKSGLPVRKPSKNKMAAFNTRNIKVKAGGSEAVFFPIVPNIIGDLPIEVEARSRSAGDRLRKQLLVEAEGFKVSGSRPVMIDLSKKASFKASLETDVKTSDPDFVRGSMRTKVSLIGDVMAPVLKNIDELVKMPYGCGEQNMINFVPNIVVLKYLTATSRLEPELESKAKQYMESGYQRELTYKRRDNSFSAFGDSDNEGSTWLTAFVVRSFHQARPFIFIDDAVMKESLNYLGKMQQISGAYNEKHAVIHTELTGGGAEAGIPLTAYIVTTMLENGESDEHGVKYLEDGLSDISTPYAAALVTYALHLAKSPMKDRAWQLLQRMAKQEDGLKFWAAPAKAADPDVPHYWHSPPPADVEMTAYALLTYVLRGQTEEALPIVRWLASKRNGQGGWSSTQDTVVALTALGAYGEKAYSPNFDVSIKLTNGRTKPQTFKVDPSNSLILQEYVGRDVRNPVELEASGKGVVFAQLSWTYNLNSESLNAPFTCTARDVSKPAQAAQLEANICCKYGKPGESGMAVMEAEALSGYEIDGDELSLLQKQPGLQRTELTKSNTQANIYFDKMDAKERCLSLKSSKVALVSEQKPAQIRLYDYYRPQDRIELNWGLKGRPETFADTCPKCWPNGDSSSLLLPNNKCKNVYKKCDSYCLPKRLTSKTYMRYLKRHTGWLRRYCKKSCASILDIQQCFM